MAASDIRTYIRSLNGSHDSVEEQIEVAEWLWPEEYHHPHEGISRTDIADEMPASLSYNLKTILGNLCDIGVVEHKPEEYEDLRVFPIASWLGSDGEIVLGEVTERAEEGINGLISHMHATDPSGDGAPAVTDGAGVTHRSVLSEAFDVSPTDVEARLRSGNPLETLNDAVEAIEEHPRLLTRSDYGEIYFRYEGYRYRLTAGATQIYRE